MERVAIYCLINYIEAHEFASSKLHEYLGGENGDSVDGVEKNVLDIARPEEERVKNESILLVFLYLLLLLYYYFFFLKKKIILFTRLLFKKNIYKKKVTKAKRHLQMINKEDVRTVYTHRAARIIILKQQKLVHHIIEDGVLSEKNASQLIEQLKEDSDRINIERNLHDKLFFIFLFIYLFYIYLLL
jgi:hypothetical protein